MTAPSLSVPAGTLTATWQQLRDVMSQRHLTSIGVVGGVVIVSSLLNSGRVALDPALPLVAGVAAAGLLGGLRGGLLAAAVAAAYAALFYSQPHSVGVPGNGLRVLVFAASAMVTGAIVGSQRDRLDRIAGGPGSAAWIVGRVRQFSREIHEARPESLAASIVSRAAALVGADMAALTVIDMRTGRHVVRAVHGTSNAAVGVEVLPGVGLAGQAIRDQRTVVVGEAPPEPARLEHWRHKIMRLVDGAPIAAASPPPRIPPSVALPQLHAGSVVATITLGRVNPDRPFTATEREMLELVSPQVALAIVNALLRGQLREASLKDALTGLYNRAYLDATLDQLLALRRRTPSDERPPLSLIMFDIDGFRELAERHGQPVADRVLRAMAALLRQRFRSSDTVARVGGDGFVVVMDATPLKAAVEAAGQVRAQLRAMALTDERGAALSVSVSAGCAMFRDEVARSEQIIRTVEAALDTARWSGPGSIVAI